MAILLSESENLKINEFDSWEKFESIFHSNHKEKVKKKYNEKSFDEIQSYLCFDNKRQSLFAFLLLSFL